MGRSRSRLAIRAALVVTCASALLCGAFLALQSYLIASTCETAERAIAAPDGRHEVRLRNVRCSDQDVTLRMWRGSSSSSVFFESDSVPTVEWESADTLDVKIGTVVSVAKSQHDVDGIRIRYVVLPGLTTGIFETELRGYEARMRSCLDRHICTFVGNHDEDMKWLRRVLDQREAHFQTFKAWAIANAESGL